MSSSPAVSLPPALAPGPVDPNATLRFVSADGTQLYGEWFAADAPRAAALVLHGYFEHCGRYRELAHVLTAAGVAVLTYDMRGHGRADGQRGYVDDIGDYLDDMDAALAELDARVHGLCPDRELPRILIAHSNGGLVLLRTLADPERCPPRIAAAILSSPFLGFKAHVSPVTDLVGKLAGRWLPNLSLPSKLAVEELTSDPEKQEERRLDTLCNDVASARWYVAALEAQEYVADHVSRIEAPTLWLVSGSDQIADPSATRVVSARLRVPPMYCEFAEMQHEVFNERERVRVFQRLLTFLNTIHI